MAGLRDYRFDRSVFVTEGDNRVVLNGMTVLAQHIRTYNPRLPYHRLEFFQVLGLHYVYAVNVWTPDGRIRIDVYDSATGAARSSMHPRNQGELLRAIDTITRDFELELDAEFALDAEPVS